MTYNTCSVNEERLVRIAHRLGVHVEMATRALLAKSGTLADVELEMIRLSLESLHNFTKW